MGDELEAQRFACFCAAQSHQVLRESWPRIDSSGIDLCRNWIGDATASVTHQLIACQRTASIVCWSLPRQCDARAVACDSTETCGRARSHTSVDRERLAGQGFSIEVQRRNLELVVCSHREVALDEMRLQSIQRVIVDEFEVSGSAFAHIQAISYDWDLSRRARLPIDVQ